MKYKTAQMGTISKHQPHRRIVKHIKKRGI